MKVTRQVVLLAAALSLLTGCGQSDRPTVRQSSMQSGDEITPAVASRAPQTADDCPAREVPHRIRPKRDAGAHAALVGAMDPKRADVGLPGTGEAGPAKTGQAASKAPGPDAAKGDSREVSIGALRLVAPKTWIREQSPTDLLLAEFSLPRAKGDPSDAQLTITRAGGGDPKGLDRLREQLKQKPEGGTVEQLRIGGNEVVLADGTGDYAEAGGPFPPPVGEGRYRVLSATVFAGGKVYFVNCTGPEKTVGQRAGEFRAFLQTMKSVD
jgi:hypothetical protein